MTVEEALRTLDSGTELRPGPTHMGDVLGSETKSAIRWIVSIPAATLHSEAWFGDDEGLGVSIWRMEKDGPHRLLVGRRERGATWTRG